MGHGQTLGEALCLGRRQPYAQNFNNYILKIDELYVGGRKSGDEGLIILFSYCLLQNAKGYHFKVIIFNYGLRLN